MIDVNLSLACNGDPQKIAETRKQIEAEVAAAAGQVVIRHSGISGDGSRDGLLRFKASAILNTLDTGAVRESDKSQGVAATVPSAKDGCTVFGVPISRIDPATNKGAQQFVGKGGDALRVGRGSVWLSKGVSGTVWRIDSKRILATLVE